MSLVLAITGASGAPYAMRLLEVLLAAGEEVHLTISPAGQAVLKTEIGREVDLNAFRLQDLLPLGKQETAASFHMPTQSRGHGTPPAFTDPSVHYWHYQNLMAPIASGSHRTRGMVICPCSGGTLAAVSHSLGTNLIHRAAEVHLKERRKLILVPRETPLSLPQIDNMRRVTEAGAVVLPASPGFYHGVQSVQDLIDFVVARICDQLGVDHTLMRRWGAGSD